MGKSFLPELQTMPSESTPLIQTVRVGPPRRRYPHQTCRRLCTIACACLLIRAFVSIAIHAFFLWPYHHHHGRHSHYARSRHNGKSFSHEKLRSILLDTPTAENAKEWSRYYTSGPHLAGKNYSQAEWTMDKWQHWGVEASIVAYDVYINYPVDHSLSLLRQSSKAESWSVAFKASLTEDVLEEDPSTALDTRVPTFHGYSASGNVTAPFVYVNYGTYQDFEDLIEAGIDLKGKIAIAKYGGIFRGLKVKRAQELGMLGTLIYSDPGDDSGITEENGYEQYPKGPARNPSSVQRGSVQFLSVRPGDPSTPGYPSKPGAPRAPVDDSTPSIPSIPISYADAIPILKALNGHGPKATKLNKYWNRKLGLGYKGVEYYVGPSPDSVVLNLYNEQGYTTTPLWDVIGVVNGTIPNEVIVVGNHRDAWIAGGAADPNSGSAILNEVVRSVGKAVEAGWKPLRTIVFASWDGEEYGLIGSTEWVEEYLPWLSDANVAYINVDVGAAGPKFQASAAPLLNQVLRDATNLVPSPNQTTKGQTVGDVWDGKISTMGSGSDFTAFQDFAGIPCIDMGFKAAHNGPVYHYHSNYDSFHWMNEYGDRGFKYHEAMAKVLGVLLGELSNTIVIPFGAAEYADALDGYLSKVEDKLKSTRASTFDADNLALRAAVSSKDVTGSADAFEESLKTVRKSLAALRVKAAELDERAAWANRKLEKGLPWWNIIGKIKLWITIANTNTQYKYFERNFLFEGGLDGRSWFKHVVFAPGLWTGYSGAVYPGLMESIDAKDYNNGLKWSGIINRCVIKATTSIK
ncbi:Vacuolar protein sorting-associated protein 70 [Tolypocladium ophioglossoides CBS 100239]|uniref:Vacuolar protein sorting-associated protein 70 n=1 Tax=Tolypocladium ophioglossoides (strain CBS 100239) TaxID=1163406 RepID=A0A0L0NAS7_TOLOC|nr:Vacuolar protein sorting-associated protein 70 [Tolypocladium ophioglossoides CBS 100239]